MKWNKFVAMVKQYPWLLEHMDAVFIGRSLKSSRLREWVENKIEYIAFRPFSELDWSAENGVNLELTARQNGLHTPDPFSWKAVEYCMTFKKKGGQEEKNFRSERRIRQFGWDNRRIVLKTEGPLLFWPKLIQRNSGEVDFCRVVKITTCGDARIGLYKEFREIFLFPPNWTPPATFPRQ